MLTTSTGTHLLDSGGDNGRAWQRNQKKTQAEFEAEDKYTIDYPEDITSGRMTDSGDLVPTVSLYHHMIDALDLDDVCNKFNKLACNNWNSDRAYGLSTSQEEWLTKRGYTIRDTWNSYNSETNLSQVVQGANVNVAGDESNFEYPEYILLQVHQGADVRGGYTDAKLFRVSEDYFDTNPMVYGTIDGVEVSTGYNGYNLTDEDGQAVPLTPTSNIIL
ncbi:hypothetical protein UFOVP1522_45 [uncultured Caudovirales phage]|uniref:Uncharacterized protein n=1 Tax=uncultured Caudovirales phage TaxID=2100421 RepID=A0A6J5Q1H9_9CAUD|nr:hypothetical protein UFOVP989_42 [uncultured Caudovirales phage]CAB4181254.1 hypothetical protein UFOVP1075_24 [uncultured Caudovirales phage]CAB4198725.1 hypothetical protein UFOVP1312_16 [uncultured Caudovirales phage]CAB4210790.1 hypothetical protein UFOVP1426_42 [uncultured Caudovirales phage]CAB5227491.1 hypothetical protein UFOVP1522_45 [uncultured Caudovirales phage]